MEELRWTVTTKGRKEGRKERKKERKKEKKGEKKCYFKKNINCSTQQVSKHIYNSIKTIQVYYFFFSQQVFIAKKKQQQQQQQKVMSTHIQKTDILSCNK